MRDQLTVFGSRMEKVFGVECFSTDTRIILYVVENTACTVKDAQFASGLSHRGFYLRLKKLKDDGFVLLSGDSDDRRKRLLIPTEKAKGLRISLLSMAVPQDNHAPVQHLRLA